MQDVVSEDPNTETAGIPLSPAQLPLAWGAQRRALGALASGCASTAPTPMVASAASAAAQARTGLPFSTAASTPAPVNAPPPPVNAPHLSNTPAELEEAELAGLDMESLMRAIVHPLPLGRVRNGALLAQALGTGAPVVQLENGPGGRDAALFFDPAATLSSTMRALHVIRQVGGRACVWGWGYIHD